MSEDQSVIRKVLIFILLSLFSFIVKLSCSIGVFAMFIAPITWIFLIARDLFLIPQELAVFIGKILLTVTPALPTYFCAVEHLKNNDESSSLLSIDLCFALWIFVAIAVWIFL